MSLIEATFTNPNIYWQSLSISLCFILSYICYKLSKRIVFPKIISITLKRNVELNRVVTRYVLPLLYPLFSVLFLAIGLSIYAESFNEIIIFYTTLKLVTLFLLLRFIRIFSNNSFITNLAGLFLIPALLLETFGLLDTTIEYLDFYALTIGTVRISIYLVIKAIVVILIVFWLSSLINNKSKALVNQNKNIKSSTKGIVNKFIDIIVYSAVFIILLKTLGFDMTTFAVLGGAIGVGIGFGLQKIASNFISGIILLFEKSVEVGDIVEIDNGGIYGTIKHFSGRYTLVEAMDGKEIMIPNEDFIIGRVTNWTYSNNRARIKIDIRVSYKDDLEKVLEVLLACAKENPRCLDYPEPECYVAEFGEYDIKITLFFWISDILEGRLSPKSDVIMRVWKKFKELGIEIPIPKREVSIQNSESSPQEIDT